MAKKISRAEAWTKAHEVFTKVNFNSYDYNTIKDSLIDYTKLYFPEDFNDYIESSEYIAILELFAYVGELLAYRLDLNAHENFITTAERKESILRLAKLISYKASRNLPARGLVKITSVQTTEQIIDSQGNNLANVKVFWNDLNNPNWKEQFILILNRVLEQDFGTVNPNERVQIEDVLFELYTLNNLPLNTDGASVFRYNAVSNGQSFPMELVPVRLTDISPVEKRPERNMKFSILYGSDGLGDGSDTTGFFMMTKQGTLQVKEEFFDGVTPNMTYDVDIENINETDVWLNNVDPDTKEILDVDPYAKVLPHLSDSSKRYGEWDSVDTSAAQNIIFNTDSTRQKYEIETLDNDKIRIIFGDGEFSDIPSGNFDIWFRTSANTNDVIQKESVVDQIASFTYLDITNSVQTLTFTFSLINSLQNASESESIEHIRRVAPSVYYTQDRMVNGRDYNSFMLQDPSILKLYAVNRTFAGDSKYIAWHDPKEYYEDVKIFGEDLALYWIENPPESGGRNVVNKALTSNEVLTNMIEPLICSADFYNVFIEEFNRKGQNISDLRCSFTDEEALEIRTALDLASTSNNPIVDLYFSASNLSKTWSTDPGTLIDPVFMIRVEAQFIASNLSGWSIRWRTKRMSAHSETTRFRHTNTTNRVVNYDTLNSNDDKVIVLSANLKGNLNEILGENRIFNVLGQELVEQNLPNAGLPDENRLSVLPTDVNNDGVPDNLDQPNLLNAVNVYTSLSSSGSPPMVEIPFGLDAMYYIINHPEDVIVEIKYSTSSDFVIVPYGGPTSTSPIWWSDGTITETGYPEIIKSIIINGVILPTDEIKISTKRYVYFYRETTTDKWAPISDTNENKVNWYNDINNSSFKREYGRYPLNFAWFYSTPRFYLVDPAASNIIDMFIITVGYYTNLLRWLEDKTSIKPEEPTPLELRTTYNNLLNNKMISDTVILHSGKLKILFGSKAIPELQAKFKVIRPIVNNMTDNEVKIAVVDAIRNFFDINDWDFGETFYFTELASSIHAALGPEINSVVLVPLYSTHQFGDLFQVEALENEIFVPHITTENIEIIDAYTPENIRQ